MHNSAMSDVLPGSRLACRSVTGVIAACVTDSLGCRAMLSDKLLSKTDYNCDREIRTLELLKLRFGDANLHNCEVGILAMPHPTLSFRCILSQYYQSAPQWAHHCFVTPDANQSNPGRVGFAAAEAKGF